MVPSSLEASGQFATLHCGGHYYGRYPDFGFSKMYTMIKVQLLTKYGKGYTITIPVWFWEILVASSDGKVLYGNEITALCFCCIWSSNQR
jgi:hypothetical protein